MRKEKKLQGFEILINAAVYTALRNRILLLVSITHLVTPNLELGGSNVTYNVQSTGNLPYIAKYIPPYAANRIFRFLTLSRIQIGPM